jgi:hypothetical protein
MQTKGAKTRNERSPKMVAAWGKHNDPGTK